MNPKKIMKNTGSFKEAIKSIRTNFILDANSKNSKVVLVTSSVPGEGKSTSALSFALALSEIERVLLIDADLRRPNFAKSLKLDCNVSGLSTLIAGTVSVSSCIQRQALGNLDVMCSGPTTDQPIELLSSKHFALIVEQLAGHYDRIVIDSAPVHAVSDALVLSKVSDAVVYAVQSHKTSQTQIRRGLERLHKVDARVTGILITQVDIKKLTSYGGDSEYQGYHDYYGYGNGRNRHSLHLSQEELSYINTNTLPALKKIDNRLTVSSVDFSL